jgi:alpha,alpha-trehalase
VTLSIATIKIMTTPRAKDPGATAGDRVPVVIRRARFDAVIFDLDGVVTRTADAHAATWKKLFDDYREERLRRNLPAYDSFDLEVDYRTYVDGKPRYDGIRSFLDARGIELPYGSPDDPPDRETVCGLANRKNVLFQQHLERAGVRVYESTVRLIRQLRGAGFKVAIISASENCPAVLQAAGIRDLFHAQVDGVVAKQLRFPGKPAPDVFLEAAKRIEVEPQRAVVVEDAEAGVQAGRAGGFALVIGVDRTGNPERLRENGADVVVADLAEVVMEDPGAPPLARRSTADLPSALDHRDEILPSGGQRFAVFLDYDGTLTPIVAHPEDAVLSKQMRGIVGRLAQSCPVFVISGRDLSDVRERVGLAEIIYAGSHGFDILGPDGLRQENPAAQPCLPALDEAEAVLRADTADIAGAQIERKKYSIAVHFRNADESRVPELEAMVDATIQRHPDLRKRRGKKVLELQPHIDWHKGRAVSWLLQTLGLDPSEVLPIYIGDDLTDEDAFVALHERGVGIVVRDAPRPTAARYALEDPAEVGSFLDWLAQRPSASRGP